ncbi:MAG: aminotransferase class V-fold PLP-dependent enzyme [Chitinophagaceae bacterium]|nr:aminotransferase class V-fold PLP-dependent enzyme [Chitinophagaceae bacterium]
MQRDSLTYTEETLDPSDWSANKALGVEMVNDMMQFLQTVRDRATWQPPSERAKQHFNAGIPFDGMALEKVYDEFKQYILPFPTGNIHPRFWGWVMGNGSSSAMLADMLASGINLNQGGGNQMGGRVETQVINWFKKLFGFPDAASGLVVSGGSMANLIGITVARFVKADFDLRKEGVYGSKKRMLVYASSEVHNCTNKAVELLGLGSDSLRLIPVNDQYEMDLDALAVQIKKDRESGMQPFCIVGNAVTVNTGAVDDLNAIADICEKENLWFHVDGAIGAMLALSEKYHHVIKGMERADSIAFDLHKWMYIPYEAGCILVRKGMQHYQTFSMHADYLAHEDRGVAAGDIWFSDYGVELSRGFKALKIWMSMKEHGIKKFGRLVTQNVEQVQYLKALVVANKKLELLAPAPMNILCFRYIIASKNEEQLNALNKELLLRLHESGVAVPSYTVLHGKYALRVANTNHRTQREDFDVLINKVIELGDDLVEEKK